MDKTGDTTDIRRYLRVLAATDGNNPQIREWVGKYGLDNS